MPTPKFHDNAPNWDKGDPIDKWLPDKTVLTSKLSSEPQSEYVGYLLKCNTELWFKFVADHRSLSDETEEWVEVDEIIGAYQEMLPILTYIMVSLSAEDYEPHMRAYEKWQKILKQRLQDHRS